MRGIRKRKSGYPTQLIIMNLPKVLPQQTEENKNYPVMGAHTISKWPGTLVVHRIVTKVDETLGVVAISDKHPAAIITSPCIAGTIDISTLTVNVKNQEPLLDGGLACLGGEEIIEFGSAELSEEGLTLHDIKRGLHKTKQLTDITSFVLLDASLQVAAIQADDLGIPALWSWGDQFSDPESRPMIRFEPVALDQE